MSLLAITKLQSDGVLAQIDAALESELTAECIAEFVASVDWSGVTSGNRVGLLLGEIELATDAYVERELSLGEYREQLRQVTRRERSGPVAG